MAEKTIKLSKHQQKIESLLKEGYSIRTCTRVSDDHESVVLISHDERRQKLLGMPTFQVLLKCGVITLYEEDMHTHLVFRHYRLAAPTGGGWADAPIILETSTDTNYSCIVCGEAMDIIEQPALLPSREATTLVTCSNPDCPAFGYTYDARDLEGEPVEGDLPDATFDGVGCVAARTTATFATPAEYDEWTSQVAAAQPDPMPVLSWRCGRCDAQHESAYFRSRAICERCGHWNEWFEVVDPALLAALHADYQARLFAAAPLNGGAR